jgi:hypothetical protein
LDNVAIEIVNHLTHIERALSARLLLDSNELAVLPLSKEAILLSGSSARGENAVSRAEDGLHVPGFIIEVAVRPLNDAKGIDPQVAYSQRPSSVDGIAKGLRQSLERNVRPEGHLVIASRAEGWVLFRISPRMGQRHVSAIEIAVLEAILFQRRCFVEADAIVRVADVDKTCR